MCWWKDQSRIGHELLRRAIVRKEEREAQLLKLIADGVPLSNGVMILGIRNLARSCERVDHLSYVLLQHHNAAIRAGRAVP